ncbi:MAG: hypothetical protein V4691_06440 [Pseudomonadota bacterium]
MNFTWHNQKEEDRAQEQRQLALSYLTGAWIEAVSNGLDPDYIAEAALEAALKELVALKGENYVEGLLKNLAPRVHNGEYSIHATRQ